MVVEEVIGGIDVPLLDLVESTQQWDRDENNDSLLSVADFELSSHRVQTRIVSFPVPSFVPVSPARGNLV